MTRIIFRPSPVPRSIRLMPRWRQSLEKPCSSVRSRQRSSFSTFVPGTEESCPVKQQNAMPISYPRNHAFLAEDFSNEFLWSLLVLFSDDLEAVSMFISKIHINAGGCFGLLSGKCHGHQRSHRRIFESMARAGRDNDGVSFSIDEVFSLGCIGVAARCAVHFLGIDKTGDVVLQKGSGVGSKPVIRLFPEFLLRIDNLFLRTLVVISDFCNAGAVNREDIPPLID